MWNKLDSSIVSVLIMTCVKMISGIDVPDFFPEINGDLTQVTWSHATNSNSSLQAALDGDIMMLEADVSLGTVNGGVELIPIMAHPPATTSDLSLEEFVTRVIEVNRKGIKLDFKSTEVLDQALEILKNNSAKLTFPVWLNADVLRGPALNTGTPVDPDIFLRSCKEMFPTATLSVGWTTSWGPLFFNGSYTERHVQEMIQTLQDNGVTQPVTFPVRGGIAAHSLTTLKTLVEAVSNSTLTVWGSETDRVDFEQLARLVLNLGKERVYIDLPETVRNELDMWLNQLVTTTLPAEASAYIKPI